MVVRPWGPGIVFAIAWASSLVALPAYAKEECTVRVEPRAPESGEWGDAIARVREHVRHVASDCDEIVVVMSDTDTVVTFKTRDGREATRRITHPRELVPMVEALSVRGPAIEPVVAQTHPLVTITPPIVSAPPGAPSTAPVPVRDEATGARPKAHTNLRVLGDAGAKAWANGALSPVAGLEARVALGNWELGVLGRWESEYKFAVEAGRTDASAVGGGLVFGRRETLGTFALAYGGTASVYAVTESLSVREPHMRRHAEIAEETGAVPRAGAYLALLSPEVARVRVRLKLDGDVSLMAMQTRASELPTLPGWGATLTLGAETRAWP
jgi:hypothetical protein